MRLAQQASYRWRREISGTLTDAELERALCRQHDNPDIWHPDTTLSRITVVRNEAEEEAKAICAMCPIRNECLQEALDQRHPHGIWGGLNEDERRVLHKKMARVS